MKPSSSCPTLVLLILATLGGPATLLAQDEAERVLGWSDKAELSFVATNGNAETSSFAFKNVLTRTWEQADLEIEANALRSESTDFRRFAVGSPEDFEVREESSTELTAENYLLAGEYKRTLSGGSYWYGRASWERNEFSGVRNRYVASAGLGHRWWENDRGHLRTSYGLSGTRQEGVSGDDGSETFLGLRGGLNYSRQLSESTVYDNVLVVDENLDDTSDLRADWLNAVAVSMTERLAIKVSLRLLFDNEPSLIRVPLEREDGTSGGETVLVEAEDLDSYLTVALVVNF